MNNRKLPTVGNQRAIDHFHTETSALATRGKDAIVELARINTASKLFSQAMAVCANVDFDRLSDPVRNLETEKYSRRLSPNEQKAEPLFRQATDLGHAEAAYCLAAFLIDKAAGLGDELGLEERSDELTLLRLNQIHEALDCYRIAGDSGFVPAQRRLGEILCYSLRMTRASVNDLRNRTEAEAWLSKAAQADDARAQSALGQLLSRIKGRRREALYWYQLAAEQGDAFAQIRFAEWCLKEIEGVPAAPSQAIHWLHVVLSNPQRSWVDEDDANTILGAACLTGLAGVQQDFHMAFQLLSRVAVREDGLAFPSRLDVVLQLLGCMREFGLGCEKDLEAAHHFYGRVNDKKYLKYWGEMTFGEDNGFRWNIFDPPPPRKPGELHLRLPVHLFLSVAMREQWKNGKSVEASKE